VHIKCVDREVVCSQVNTFKNLSQSQMLAVTVKDNLVRALLHPADLERQRATSTRSPRVNGTAPDVLQQYHTPGTPRIRIIDGKTVLKENLEPNPFEAKK